jgi:hypothetical protein
MKRAVFGLAGAISVLGAADASGAAPAHRFGVGASLGYAFPVGDETYGVVPLELDGTYRLARAVGVGLSARYGPAIPNLCSSFDDCTGSIGSDVAITAHTRCFLPRVGPILPAADLGFGYEWFASRLTDSGVTSTRSHHGPILLRVDLLAPFELSSHWSLGPALAAMIGTFTSGSLDTPAGEISNRTDERSVHAWLSVACRLAASF